MSLDNVEAFNPSMASFSISPETHSPEVSGYCHVSESPVERDIPLCSYCASRCVTTKGHREGDIASHCACCELKTNALPSNVSQAAANEMLYTQFERWWPSESVISIDSPTRKIHGKVHINAHHQLCPLDIPATIDFRNPTEWLEHCEKVHGMDCNQRNLPERYSNPIDIILVDVLRECLVQMTTASRYFALSYVWGGAVTVTATTQNFSTFQQVGSLHDTALPTTVSDAMRLTREMGERYLWVDCLSIIQDSFTKHQDIVNMDIIFAKAELTIVTTCGDDANAALAGIRPNTRRPRTMSKQHGNCLLTLYLPTSKYGVLYDTIYSSRGWTFQELLLSKRILFVSPQQIVFHCTRSRRSESFPRERPHNTHFGDGNGKMNLFPEPNSVDCDMVMLKSYTTMVQNYSAKCLSFQSDVENAFAGLASILEGWHKGSPVVHGYMSVYFAFSMTWMFHPGSYDKYWPRNDFGRKRNGFPTWSWVAWPAEITFLGSPDSTKLLSARLPVLSRVRNVEIALFNEREHSRCWNIEDKTSLEDRDVFHGQRIHIELDSKRQDVPPVPQNLLAFDAEYTCWHYYSTHRSCLHFEFLKLMLPDVTQFCGFLSVTPNREIVDAAVSRNANAERAEEVRTEWSLVRLYQFQLHPSAALIEGLHNWLVDLQDWSDPSQSAKAYGEALHESELFFVLLVRRQGAFWERMGSGIMIAEYWPSIDGPESFRSYQDRIVLI